MNWLFKLGVVACVMAAFIGMVVAQNSAKPSGPKRSPAGLPVETIKISGEGFEAEIAADMPSRMKGLGGRPELGKNEAMIFVFQTSELQRFWMKDCTIDIDAVFMDRTGKITATHVMTKEPPRGATESEPDYEARLKMYASGTEALYALELAPGSIDRLGLKVGQTITLDHGKLRGYLR